jgi:hypothetical protein
VNLPRPTQSAAVAPKLASPHAARKKSVHSEEPRVYKFAYRAVQIGNRDTLRSLGAKTEIQHFREGAITMKTRFATTAALLVGLLIASLPLLAHHGNAAFDTGSKVTVTGTVTEWTWTNPHCYLKVDAKDGKGVVKNWYGEVNNPAVMTSLGWKARDFKPGDQVTMTLTVAKNGVAVGKIQTVILADGRKLFAQRDPNAPAEP